MITNSTSTLFASDFKRLASPKLVIGIGDIHGHYPALESLLSGLQNQYGIFDDIDSKSLRQDVELVFTGDYIDRGTQGLKIIDTVKCLQENNSNVSALFGNHELLALAGLDAARSVIGTNESSMFGIYAGTSLHGYNGGNSFIKEFGNTPRSAFESYIKRVSRGGDIGDWMRQLKPMHPLTINGKKVLFIHAGIPHELKTEGDLDSFVEEFKRHMSNITHKVGGSTRKYFEDKKVDGNSVFWDRRFHKMDKTRMDEIVDSLGLDYVVIGHTPKKDLTNYHDRVFDIDVGMCPTYGGNEPTAIVFKPDGVFAFYIKKSEKKLVEYTE